MQEQGKNTEFIRYLAMNALSIFHTPTFFEGSYFVDDYLSLYHYINYILSYHELPNVYESINFRYTDYDSIHYNPQPYQCKKISRDMNIEHAANISTYIVNRLIEIEILRIQNLYRLMNCKL